MIDLIILPLFYAAAAGSNNGGQGSQYFALSTEKENMSIGDVTGYFK